MPWEGIVFIMNTTPDEIAPLAAYLKKYLGCGRRAVDGLRQLLSDAERIVRPAPYTLHPTPYTLHPAPHTPHPTPYTLHPHTLHPNTLP